MRRTNNARRGLGIRGQLMFFLCFICLFLLVLFWILSTQLLARGEKHLLDRNRYYFKLLRQIVSAGQEAGQLRRDRTVNDIVKAYALWERALLYDWCLCGGEYSLRDYASQVLPSFLSGLLPDRKPKNSMEL